MVDIPIQVNDRRIQFTAIGGELQFDADFLIFKDTDVTVRRTDVVTGVTTDLVLATDYTIVGLQVLTGFSVVLDTVVFPAGAVAGDIFTVFGDIPIERLNDFQTGGDYDAQVVNAEQDTIFQIMQELNTKLVRSLRLLEEDPFAGDFVVPITRANLFLAFDALGAPVATSGPITGIPVSTFWEGILGFTDFPSSGIAALALVNAWTRAQGFPPAALTDAPTVTWDGDTQQNATLGPLTQNFTLANITGARAGFTYVLVITQDPVTPRTITFGANYRGVGGVLPTLTATINAVDRLTVYAHSPTFLEVGLSADIS